jgi:hypothetical protein
MSTSVVSAVAPQTLQMKNAENGSERWRGRVALVAVPPLASAEPIRG